jgi:predicted MFS family arabinose efflux permease
MLTAGLEGRRLLAIGVSGFSIANLIAALVSDDAGLLAARLLPALGAACVMPAASEYAAASSRPLRRGRALSTVTTGLTPAIVAGVPLGVVIGEGFSRRATFLAVAGLAAFSLTGILAGLPQQLPGVAPVEGERLVLAKRRDILSVLSASVLTVGVHLRSTVT